MTGLKTRSADYQPVHGPITTNMAELEKNGELPQEGSDTETESGADNHEKTRCGWGPFSPDCCQRFRRPGWFLFWLSWGGAMQGLIVNGFVNVVISTIERRFEISSTDTGTIASCYDIAAVICLIPISYLGGRGQKPLYLGVGFFILAIGSFTFSLPHFTTSLYEGGEDELVSCVTGTNLTACSKTTRSLSDYKYVFFLGQLLHGVGATPLYTLGTVYLDENLPVRSASVYQGAFYAFAIIGPAIGYLAGGAFLDLYTDFHVIDTSALVIDKENPRWVGAWWLGFLISGSIAMMIAVPMCGFPIRLPGSEKYQAEREAEVYQTKKSTEHSHQSLGLRDIWISFKMLVTNPTFMCLNFAAACEGLMVSGFSTFAPKFIEYQFGLSSGVAAMYVGLAAIPAGGGATFVGGFIVKRFNLTVRGILKFCIGVTVVACFLALTFLIHCPYVPFYYSNCSCIDYQFTADDNATGSDWLARQGTCESDCQWLPLFLPLLAVLMCTIFITSMPALSATLRCVPQERRSLGLGIQWIIARCLGSIPGPILFGKIIDLTCLLWQESCDGEGACFFYDKKQMSYNLLATGIAGTIVSVLCFTLALLFYRTTGAVEKLEEDIPAPQDRSDSRSTSMTHITQMSTPAATPATTPSTEHPTTNLGSMELAVNNISQTK
ncbi:hypothetical protein BaRGS_00023135 [Batillaria attramentaria]|uniref:Solute carrier organic anion transporter family member n=1 Tax=Batillaria attramentaria TaxID=370345 RepID=A0ABD0KEZ3_9CAEN